MKTSILNITVFCIALVCLNGCSHEDNHSHDQGSDSTRLPAVTNNHSEHSHEIGRHGGRLAVMGGHNYHAETMIVNTETGEIVIEITGKDSKTSTNINANELTLIQSVNGQPKTFIFNRENKEREKDFITFSLSDIELAKTIQAGNWEDNITLSLTIEGVGNRGNLFKGKINNKQDHHDHDHDHHDHDHHDHDHHAH
ncbi:MAG: hypothetical protein LBB88_11540 [Planctomycetaceae bacterium]|jgi:hypothetical protein|nr:hypothetical protein [Planctomycetaceae bacterium]